MNNRLKLWLARGLGAIMISVTVVLVLTLAGAAAVYAQSSGSFTASVDNTVCSINSSSGILNSMFTQGSGGGLSATIKLPGSLPGLLVTPSLETGMYTNTLSANDNQSQTAAIVVVVTDAVAGYPTVTLTPNQTCVDTSATGTANCPSDPACKCGVVYDERFQYLSTILGSGESVQLILSTLSAHSFNFTEGNVPGGIHTLNMNWYFGCDNGSGNLRTANCKSTFLPNTAAACAGPGTLTVQQVQQFQHSSQIGTTGP